MAYCTSNDIRDSIGGAAALTYLTDINNTTTDANAVTSAIEAATARIDAYATGTPGATGTSGSLWDTTPPQAKQFSIDIAIYVLYQRIWREIPTDVELNYTNAIKQLELLQAGKVSWVPSEDPAVSNTGKVFYFGPGSTNRTANPRRTTRTSLDTL